ncbi:MAG: ABC transporter ATP-binding protein [Gammaproteobacteria bacterium]
MSLACEKLTVGISDRLLVDELDLEVGAGEFLCVLGPNGVGKTLSLHTIAGLRPAQGGGVRLHGDRLEDLDRPAIAQRLGLLLQSHDDAFPITVLETALMGRHARLGFWQWETAADMALADAALTTLGLTELRQRMSATLSGGERRRLALATLLVQDPDVLLLDEPMNHLDPMHKLDVLRQLRGLAAAGKTIVASMHDPLLAWRFADSVLMLHGDGNWESGPVAEMLTIDRLQNLYGTPFAEFTRDGQSVMLPVPLPDAAETTAAVET